MPTGDPVLGSSRGDRQLLRNDLKDSNASSGHARDCRPTAGQAAPGDRRCGTRSARASATTAGTSARTEPGETYVPTHEGRITWDICPDPRHPRSPSVQSAKWLICRDLRSSILLPNEPMRRRCTTRVCSAPARPSDREVGGDSWCDGDGELAVAH